MAMSGTTDPKCVNAKLGIREEALFIRVGEQARAWLKAAGKHLDLDALATCAF